MLTRELAIAEYDSGQVKPDRLTRNRHSQYSGLAEEMLTVYRNGVGTNAAAAAKLNSRPFRERARLPDTTN